MEQERSIPLSLARPARASRIGFATRYEILGIDLRTLALFRVLLGSFLILDLGLRARDLAAHYTDFGVMPRDALVGYLSPGAFSLHMMNGAAAFQAVLFCISGLFALMMIAGWRTRLATVASWILLLSLQNRNTVILSGEDNLVMVLMFWAMFLPLGARYSVDAALDNGRERAPNAFFSIATLALLIQGMSMYFFSALLKSDAKWIPDGTAIYYALQLDYFATPFALWFRQFEDLMQGLTYYVWLLELIGPILIFTPIFHRPVRAALMAAFITMHFGFFLCLEIGIFPLVSVIMNLTFMPGWMWDAIAGWLRPRTPADLRIWYDRDCGFCLKMCRLLTTFIFLSHVPMRPAQDDPHAGPLLAKHNTWVITEGGKTFLKWDALRHLFACSPILWPVGKLLSWAPLRRLGDWTYQWIARNRPTLGRVFDAVMPWRTLRIGPSRFTNAMAAACLCFVTVQNISTLPEANLELPKQAAVARQFLGLYQNWTMFAPHPEMTSPWPVILGKLNDGSVVDVYNRHHGIPDFFKPEVVSAVYANYRWRKYLSNLEDQSYEAVPQRLALGYSRYLCRLWNTDTPADRQLSGFEIFFNVAWTPPPGEPKTETTRSVWTHDCGA